MPSGRLPLPANWTDYERGGRRSSSGASSTSRVHWDTPERQASESGQNGEGARTPDREQQQQQRRRRSSVHQAVESIRKAGGVNSIDNFARSWQRATGFYEITPLRPSFKYTEAEENGEPFQRQEAGNTSSSNQRSLLRAALDNEVRRSSVAIDDEESVAPESSGTRRDLPVLERIASLRDDNIFNIEPSLASSFGGNFGTQYGSLAERVNESSMRHAGRLFRQQQAGTTAPDKERAPLLVKRIEEEDGKVINVVVGQSTLPQTVFNSANVLIGIGLLALPLAVRYAGWIPGLLFFAFSAVVTSYTAKLLAKCLDVDSSLITFADLAFVSFGHKARVATSILFSLELMATCVALVVLFSDSLEALLPSLGVGLVGWKIVCGIILLPLGFMPLRFLSFTSILGILCCLGIVLALFIDGLVKPHQPGSLREPATTHFFPAHWGTLPLSFGLLMSPWGGHSVFPNIYRDMRHPAKYHKGVNITYTFTFLLDLFMAVVGLLMFGDNVRDEVTSNILSTNGYPQWISVFIAICVAIIPLTKVPLNARPIVSTIEIFAGLDARAVASSSAMLGVSGFNRGLLKMTIRILSTVVFVVLAILFPSFDRIMSLLGSVACFTICVILPLAFHLKLFGKEIGRWERFANWSLIAVSSVLALVSTVFNFFPKEMIGAT
ncbi:hypothetical protein LTR66_013038 [Elasticomyces elasticus]|nr:hypothetical protein LTR66_013038 [Elasticomyces elasticus]